MDKVTLAKLPEKLKIRKVEGITRRWLFSILGVIAVLFIVTFVVASAGIKDYYYNSVEDIVKSGASDNAVSYFTNNIANGSSVESSAAEFVNSYAYKNRTTIWIIDDRGNVVLSSSGFHIDKQDMPDYNEAFSNPGSTAKYVGKIDNGEKIMAVSRAIVDSDGLEIGAIRVMTNIDEVDTQIRTLRFILFLILLFVMGIIVFSNQFFIRSIIIPVQEVKNATKLIADGNLDVRIEKKYDDEIGDLADSINTMATEISAADKMKNDFISTISHELRTPLTSIKGWGEP
ncbi:MAG: HAMP domain-containing protein [Ruminococcaceae bacterium]|nr:HAMP domain-containing protein [Oscillospiraceae bacterium]